MYRREAAWFDKGNEERAEILKIRHDWSGQTVLEIGCGAGELCNMVRNAGAKLVVGVDYSSEAIRQANDDYPTKDQAGRRLFFRCDNYRNLAISEPISTLIMQGVLEHLDDPWGDLKWMMERFRPQTVITSSPGFCNPRGIVWMLLWAFGGVPSKTDLHYLHPWQFERFAKENGLVVTMRTIELDWAFGEKMLDDLRQRVPLAIRDGDLPMHPKRLEVFFDFLEKVSHKMFRGYQSGAVNVYRLDRP